MNYNIIFILLLGSLLMILEVKADDRRKASRRQKDDADFVPVTQQSAVVSPQPRIVGGNNANEGQFPYQISLRVGESHICGGSIISQNYVVTAAHCVTKNIIGSSPLSVRAGSVSINSGGQIVGVSTIINHPSYASFNNDIALLKLASPLQFNDRVKAVALASRAPRAGAQIVASGWGRIGNDGPLAQILQYTTLTALSNAQCRQRLSSVPSAVLCFAHSPGNGVCNGDSGGPAVYQNQLVGVANYVVGGCASNNPDGYASIAIHLDWIKNNSDV